MLNNELKVAIKAITNASLIINKIYDILSILSVKIKEDKSPVTIADYCSQLVIINEIVNEYPSCQIVMEEDIGKIIDDNVLKDQLDTLIKHNILNKNALNLSRINKMDIHDIDFDRNYWILDPIDGTKGYICGRQYAIALALVMHREVVLGVLGCPRLNLKIKGYSGRGNVFYAYKTKGAFIKHYNNDICRKIHVNRIKNIKETIICESYERSHFSYNKQREILKILDIHTPPMKIDGQVKYALVANGQSSVYLRYPNENAIENVWDHAAGSIIVSEAGGCVTDLLGNRLDFSKGTKLINNNGILATNGYLHKYILKRIYNRIE